MATLAFHDSHREHGEMGSGNRWLFRSGLTSAETLTLTLSSESIILVNWVIHSGPFNTIYHSKDSRHLGAMGVGEGERQTH